VYFADAIDEFFPLGALSLLGSEISEIEFIPLDTSLPILG